MKVNKCKANSKGKGGATMSPRTQTITSMFKKQAAALKRPVSSPCKSVSSDDDVKIIGEESPYFKGKITQAPIRRSLSLKKSKSAKVTETRIDSEKEIICSTVAPEEGSMVDSDYGENGAGKRATRKNLSSKQSLTQQTACTGIKPDNRSQNNSNTCTSEDTVGNSDLESGQKKTMKDENLLESSQKENSCGKKERRLFTRKRKSDATTDISADTVDKKYKTEDMETNFSSANIYEEKSKKNSIMKLDSSIAFTSKNKDLSDSVPTHSNSSSTENKVAQTHKTKSTEERQDPQTKSKDAKKATKLKKQEVSITSKKDLDDEENSQQVGDDNEEEDKSSEFRTPYYLENFRTVLNTVFEDENNAKLYNSDDMEVITAFSELSETAQKLYLRLFCRKWTWFPLTKLKYPGIAEDLEPFVTELTERKLLVTDNELCDLGVTLKLLSGGDIKTLGKMYHINTASQNKVDITELLMKKTKQNTIGSMFKMVGNSPETVMLNRAKKLLGTCIHVAEEPRNVFARTLMLFSLTDTVLDEDSSGQSLQLFQMLRVNIGQVIYPTFTVNKQTQVFPDRGALLRFCEASLIEFEILTKLERHKYNEAFVIYQKALEQYDQLIKDKKLQRFDRKLPVFLRPYTACGVYTRVLNQGVEILQRKKDYQAAVDLLNKLLDQDCYCQHYRGHWWERLTLNFDTHLKRQDMALQAAKDGLNDKLCRTGRRLALYQRAEKICTATKSKYKARMKEFQHEKLMELPLVTIEGQTLSDNIEGQKYKFMISCSQENGQTDTDDFAFCCVEEVVLDHYKHNGFTDGIHAEGSVISCLFGLLFWDILFMDVADVFHSPYQTHPLDLHTEDFYINRQKVVDERLSRIESSSIEELQEMLADTWKEHEGTLCSGLNWERFKSLDHIQGLVECIGGKTLSGILGRYVRDPRHTRSGFPDLTLWNTETKHFKICEVKGPGDKLSHKQILWLDYLLKLGVNAEVCHVKAVGSKRLKKSNSETGKC